MGKVYRNMYPLFVLSNTGAKKMGEMKIALKFAPYKAAWNGPARDVEKHSREDCIHLELQRQRYF
jgi:hypothetical protein